MFLQLKQGFRPAAPLQDKACLSASPSAITAAIRTRTMNGAWPADSSRKPPWSCSAGLVSKKWRRILPKLWCFRVSDLMTLTGHHKAGSCVPTSLHPMYMMHAFLAGSGARTFPAVASSKESTRLRGSSAALCEAFQKALKSAGVRAQRSRSSSGSLATATFASSSGKKLHTASPRAGMQLS